MKLKVIEMIINVIEVTWGLYRVQIDGQFLGMSFGEETAAWTWVSEHYPELMTDEEPF